MRHLSIVLSAAALWLAACGGSSTTDDGGNTVKDMAQGGGSDPDLATPDLTTPDLADNKPIINLTKEEQAPAFGPCVNMATLKGKGTVTSDVGGINCGSTCTATYTRGQMVTLTAVPEAKTTKFVGWEGACTGAGLTCKVSVDGTTNVKAIFIRDYFASIQLTDQTGGKAVSISAYRGANMTNKFAEVLPSPNNTTTTTCLDLVDGDKFYVGLKIPATGVGVFGDAACVLPNTCEKVIATGGQAVFYRVFNTQ